MEKNLTDLYRRCLALPGELEKIDSKFDSWSYLDGNGTLNVSLQYDCDIIYREHVDDILNNIEEGYKLLRVVIGFAKMHLFEINNPEEVNEVEFGPLVGLDVALTQIMGR